MCKTNPGLAVPFLEYRQNQLGSVTQSCLTLWHHGLKHARFPYPSPTPRACTNSCPSSWWFHPTISVPFSFHLQSFPASGSFPTSQFFTSGGQSIGVSASVLPMNILDWFPLGWFLKNYGQRFVTLYRRQWLRPSQRKGNAKTQNGCLRRPYKRLRKEELKAKEKQNDTLFWMQSSLPNLDTSLWSDTRFVHVFYHSLGCIFTFLMVSSKA